ncbi:unnamed protein product [Microthlaspi erraticum]|uniref:Reverse transcriptase n=1 Tax=Microthlaspi erraticum TaxID=1685480 RepID=A0A6D2IE86_9BRAS|nr:unnamed protein product [Microthlaspi erraticum]
MAVETRSQSSNSETEDSLSSRIDQVLQRTQTMEEAIARQNATLAEQTNTIARNNAEMFEALRLIARPTTAPNSSNPATSSDPHPPTRSSMPINYAGVTRLAKLDFPRFNGEKLKEWLFKAEQFFEIDHTPEEVKVAIVSIHLDDLAATWHQSMIQSDYNNQNLKDWRIYKKLLKERFNDVLDDPIMELKMLCETDGIVDYHNKFENIRTRVNLSEEYLVSHYLAGLKLETQMHVRMFEPQTVRQCLMLGRLYEKAHPVKGIGTSGNNSRPFTVTKGNFNFKKESGTQHRLPHQEKKTLKPQLFLTPEQMADKRAKGECYYCPEKYSREHFLTHKDTQLFCMVPEEDGEEVECLSDREDDEPLGEIAQISLNAMTGVTDFQTMRVKGVHKKRSLFMLVDSGSTHNFLDVSIAKKLSCKMLPSGNSRVVVADGNRLKVEAGVAQFQWDFQGTSFTDDFMVIPLNGCDVVLGVQWLKKFGPITWDFQHLTMKFFWCNKKVVLHGIHPGSVRAIKAEKLNKLQDENIQLSMLCLTSEEEPTETQFFSLETETSREMNHPEISNLLEEFKDIFEEAMDLPPFRENHNHKIQLIEGANPVNQRPYRYAVHQKNEIDKIVQEMLDGGTIQQSSSSFASPVVLVKKKDGSWRLCVDYRSLNGLTVKDRFPIPLIEDLMDELGGSSIYSKIDLRAGYHQVRMASDDIHKTAFKTHSGHFEYMVMPFGLTNAPATFQGLMNATFKEFLRKFVLIFFDDILIYSNSVVDHVHHLGCVFKVMREQRLFAKRSKCAFATRRVEYLGHFIEERGISTDPSKIQAVERWPVPTNLKQLRGFLGLAGYYRRFVKKFGTIARPLTLLTKKDSFVWSTEANEAFCALKTALCTAPVLALPRFDRPFVVETDASGQGIGVVLMQDGHPLAYISLHLKGKQLHLSIYEKELLAVVFAVQKWRHYLLNGHFVIKTDQRSLKYLLEQRLNTPIQQQWLPKLLEFDYEIQYKEGKENLVADALSRVEGSEVLHMALSVLECDLLKQIQAGYLTDTWIQSVISDLQTKPGEKTQFTWNRDILRRKSKIVVPAIDSVRNAILEWLHCSGIGGHSGRDATHQRVKGIFYWKAASPGLIQPLPIPTATWSDISMDFIDGLPLSSGKSVIFVVVDRLTKAAHFMALAHPYTAISVAQLFLANVFKLHGLPTSIVSDIDAVFLSDFWRELFTLQGVALNYSSAYHPQSDGQTEVVNRCLKTYLRCMCSDRPHLWSKWLPLAEFWYNTSYHSSAQMSPYEAVYGQSPPQHLPYIPGESKVAVVAQNLQERENMLLILKFHLLRAQHRMEQQANKRRSERSFVIGDLVYVKLQPYRQGSVVMRMNQKLAPKYYGPYKILDKCGKVAYKLELPHSSRIHPVFHVSLLKLRVGDVVISTQLPNAISDVLTKEPERILERRTVKRHNRAVTEVLVKWTNEDESEATWEYLLDLTQKYPSFQP